MTNAEYCIRQISCKSCKKKCKEIKKEIKKDLTSVTARPKQKL